MMKPFSYYQTTSVSIPNKDDYMTIYYYRKGVMVGMKRQFDADFRSPNGCVEEYVLDEVSYNAHLKHYHEEIVRLQNEFRRDLISKYGMISHPKADKIFEKAWELAGGSDLRDVEDNFMSLVELVRTDEDLIIGSDPISSPDDLSYDSITGFAIFN
jgi:hypothetical protein